VIAGALNVECIPARGHDYPYTRYRDSSLLYANGGLVAFAYLSVIGNGKNYQLNPSQDKYHFVVDSGANIVFADQSLWPGKILAPVQLTGPADGSVLDTNGPAFGCLAVENAVRYQLLLGSDPDRVMDYSVISDTTSPPNQVISGLSQARAWWTVKAFDQFGSTIYADPRLINRPANHPPVPNAGPDLVVSAGLDGTARVTLDSSNSTDPDGDALSYTWAWSIGASSYLSNGMSLAVDLPVGVHTAQVMVNDGQTNSQPVAVKVTVVPSLVCQIVSVPSDGFAFNITGVADTPIVIESCTNLANPVWVSLQSCTLTNGALYFIDPAWTNYPGQFYRIRSP
jgi:hypothetical protein